MTVFIKPHNNQFCIAVFIVDDFSDIALYRVAFKNSESEVIHFLKNHICLLDKVFFDGTIHSPTGISIRNELDLHGIMNIYKQKDGINIHDRIESQNMWILDNICLIDEQNSDADYNYFVRLLSDYTRTNPNADTIAADLMADAARYLRKISLSG